MSFVEELARVQSSPLWEEVRSDTCAADAASIPGLLGKPGRLSLDDFATLISSKAEPFLEAMGQASRSVTRQRFGRVMRLFAPLYVSNECINNCSYCGFSRDNPILRVTLSLDEVEREGHALASQGFRNILVVAGEHPKFISNGYLADCVKRLREIVPSISLEVGPMDSPDYAQLTEAGAEGLVVYQETYDRTAYGLMHTAGPKRDFDYRLKTPERAYHA
ncbi:MAG: 2-iminoacetate synthase ThiH, partial [Verrucomicrobia bacterium]|nr:2-iminoacetate synthase ThiH [Verrucomicrobiota bacterium]